MEVPCIMKTLKRNEDLSTMIDVVPNVVYSEQTGQKLTLLLPWPVTMRMSGMLPNAEIPARPLLVFLQGSGWTFPDINHELAQLVDFARSGYVVATLEHRSSADGFPFPAFLQDVKCAIRFLRKNAGIYGIDPDRVAMWGTSSGGNTALLVAETANDPAYRTGEYEEYDDSVCAVVSCFGPTDVGEMLSVRTEIFDPEPFAKALFGEDNDHRAAMERAMSPIYQISTEKPLPPLLLMHGTADSLVSFEQMTRMCSALDSCGKEYEAYQVEGADHENDFWSQEVFEVIAEFLDRHLKGSGTL